MNRFELGTCARKNVKEGRQSAAFAQRASHKALVTLTAALLTMGCKSSGPESGTSGTGAATTAAAATTATGPLDPAALPESLLGEWKVENGYVGYALLLGPTSMKSLGTIGNIKWDCRTARSCSFSGQGKSRLGESSAACGGTITLAGGSLIVEASLMNNPDGGQDTGPLRDMSACERFAGSYKRPEQASPEKARLSAEKARLKDQLARATDEKEKAKLIRQIDGKEPEAEEPAGSAPSGNGRSERFPAIVEKFIALNELKQEDFAKSFKGTTLSGSGTVFEVGKCDFTDDSSAWAGKCLKITLDSGVPRVALYYGPKDREKIAGYSKGQSISFSGCVANSIKNWGMWSTATCDMP